MKAYYPPKEISTDADLIEAPLGSQNAQGFLASQYEVPDAIDKEQQLQFCYSKRIEYRITLDQLKQPFQSFVQESEG